MFRELEKDVNADDKSEIRPDSADYLRTGCTETMTAIRASKRSVFRCIDELNFSALELLSLNFQVKTSELRLLSWDGLELRLSRQIDRINNLWANQLLNN